MVSNYLGVGMIKNIFVYPLLITSLIFGFGWNSTDHRQTYFLDNKSAIVSGQSSEIIPNDIVQNMIEEVNLARALTDLRRLTGVEPICVNDDCYTIMGRETGSEGLQWAKDYVYQTLINLNYSVEIVDWSLDGYEDQNIIARKKGYSYPNKDIYFVANLDGYQVNNPAADDNASGVVTLLELARILKNKPMSYSVVLFFSTGTEHGVLGTQSFVEEYPERLDRIKQIVSVNMVGYDSDNDGKMEFWTGDQPKDFAQSLVNIIKKYPEINLEPEIVAGCT